MCVCVGEGGRVGGAMGSQPRVCKLSCVCVCGGGGGGGEGALWAHCSSVRKCINRKALLCH